MAPEENRIRDMFDRFPKRLVVIQTYGKQATGHVDICGGGHQVSIRETSGLAVFPDQGAGVAGEAGGLRSGNTYPWASVTVRNLALTLSVLGTSG